ncbi:PilR protein [Escherichia coli]|nr:PilR protein [Escherichia coli]
MASEMQRRMARLALSGSNRIRFYEVLKMQIMSGRTLEQAMLNIREVYTRGGQRFHPFGVLAQDCLDSLSVNREGNLLPDVFRRWFSGEEAASLAVGMRAGSLLTALDSLIRLIRSLQSIRSVIAGAALAPFGAILALSGILTLLSVQLVRSSSKLSRRRKPVVPLHHLRSGGLRHHSRPLGAGYAHCVFFAGALVPAPLDRPDTAVFRSPSPMEYVPADAEQCFSAQPLHADWCPHDLSGCPENAQRRRCAVAAGAPDTAQHHFSNGADLGTALERAGHNFPSQEMILHLKALSAGKARSWPSPTWPTGGWAEPAQLPKACST